MTTPLFDVQAGFGGVTPGNAAIISAEELVAEMRRVDIGRALARITPEELDTDVPASNQALYAACAAHPALTACPVVIPYGGDGILPPAAQVEAVIHAGAGAVSLRPGPDYWSLAPWASGELFAALEEKRMPVLCLERLVSLTAVGELAGRHPRLPLIVAEVSYREYGILFPLLSAFPNVYLSTGNNLSIHRGIETLTAAVGAERLLFGSGFPVSEPMAAIAQLMYAEISEAEREAIGAGNFSRLLEEVAR